MSTYILSRFSHFNNLVLHHKIKKMMKKTNLISLMIFLISISLVAQKNDSLKTRKAQVTFAFPVGSNGKTSLNYSNNFSFNILYGLNGGVNGAEIGSLFNYNNGIVDGFQLAGLSNISGKYSRGVIISGLTNICEDSSSGFLSSGLLNYTAGNSRGFQLSTFNITNKVFSGFQLGVFNYAKKLNGIQVGVINIIEESEKGIPIGLFSIVKKGYYEIELTGSEVLYANINYKMGIEKLYTIFKIGYYSYKNNPVYSLGLGFGSKISINEKQNLNIDISTNNLLYDAKWKEDLNLLNKLDINYKYNISKQISFLVGPSFNIYVTKQKVSGEYGTIKVTYTIQSKKWMDGKMDTWVGFNLGLSYKL